MFCYTAFLDCIGGKFQSSVLRSAWRLTNTVFLASYIIQYHINEWYRENLTAFTVTLSPLSSSRRMNAINMTAVYFELVLCSEMLLLWNNMIIILVSTVFGEFSLHLFRVIPCPLYVYMYIQGKKKNWTELSSQTIFEKWQNQQNQKSQIDELRVKEKLFWKLHTILYLNIRWNFGGN